MPDLVVSGKQITVSPEYATVLEGFDLQERALKSKLHVAESDLRIATERQEQARRNANEVRARLEAVANGKQALVQLAEMDGSWSPRATAEMVAQAAAELNGKANGHADA